MKNGALKITKQRSKYLFRDSLFALVVVLSPFVFYLYDLFPDTKEVEFYSIRYTSFHFEKIQYMAYFFFSKITPLCLLFVWFLSSKKWWIHALVVPISMYVFQAIGVINNDLMFFDQNEFMYSIPIIVAVLIGLYFTKFKISKYFESLHAKENEFALETIEIVELLKSKIDI